MEGGEEGGGWAMQEFSLSYECGMLLGKALRSCSFYWQWMLDLSVHSVNEIAWVEGCKSNHVEGTTLFLRIWYIIYTYIYIYIYLCMCDLGQWLNGLSHSCVYVCVCFVLLKGFIGLLQLKHKIIWPWCNAVR